MTKCASHLCSTPAKASPRVRWSAYALLALIALSTTYIRVRFLSFPLERDEGEYAYAGQLLLQGIAPYKLAYSMKFPGTYAAYALIMAIFGASTVGIHLGLLVVTLGIATSLYFVSQRLFGEIAGILAATFYLLLSTSPWVAGFCAHATHFVVLAVLVGTLLLLQPSMRPHHLLLGGGCFGLAILMKQPGVLFLPLGCGLALLRDRAERRSWFPAIGRNMLLLAAAVCPVGITFVLLWSAGVFPAFWKWTVEYSRLYGSEISLRDGMQLLRDRLASVILPAWPIWILAGVGLGLCFWKIKRTREGIIALLLLVTSALAVCPGFYFREHYFILLLPAVALLAAVALNELARLRPRSLAPVAVLIAATVSGFVYWSQREPLFLQTPVALSQALYWPNPFIESVKVAEFLEQNSRGEDSIAILGSEPQIYFYANRHSATGYLYTYPLMEPQPMAETMQREMISEIEQAKPRYLIIVNVDASWLRRATSDQTIFDWANTYCAQHYRLCGAVKLISPGSTEFLLPVTSEIEAPTGSHLLIYERITNSP